MVYIFFALNSFTFTRNHSIIRLTKKNKAFQVLYQGRQTEIQASLVSAATLKRPLERLSFNNM